MDIAINLLFRDNYQNYVQQWASYDDEDELKTVSQKNYHNTRNEKVETLYILVSYRYQSTAQIIDCQLSVLVSFSTFLLLIEWY